MCPPRLAPWLAVSCLFALAACNTKPAPGTSPSASAAAPPPPSAASATASAPAAPPPEDLDVASLQKALRCPVGQKIGLGPCGVLAGFASCTNWSGTVPGADGRWLGRGYTVEHGKTTDQFTLLRLIKVPAAEVGLGQLPVKIAIADIPKENGPAHNQADRAIRAYERQDVPNRGNTAVDYVKTRTSWTDAHATRTAGGQIYVITDGGTYICQGSKQQLFIVQKDKMGAGNGDGLYAEVWATSW